VTRLRWGTDGGSARRPASQVWPAVPDEVVEPHHQVQNARVRLRLVCVEEGLDLQHVGLPRLSLS
jgi:hypothetical protein